MESNPKLFKKSVLAISIAAGLASTAGSVNAQQKDEAMVEEVLVRGIRSSLERSLDIKRDSNQIVEAITADDIGKMPDQNVAESLQRLPGIQIDRRDGEGTTVRIRGLDQNITLLNGNGFVSGMEYFQMGEAKTEYGGSLEGIPSELLGGLEVYKSPQASLIEGGMGGVVNLKTRDPLKLDDLVVAGNLKADYGFNSEELKPSAFIVAGNRWDNFAVIASLSATQKTTSTDSYDAVTRGIRLNTMPSGAQFISPSLAYITDAEMERERVGGSINAAWEVNDTLTLGFDWFHSDLNVTNQSYTVKHTFRDNNDNLNTPEEEAASTLLDVGMRDYKILTKTRINMGEAEMNTSGEVFDATADNFVFKMEANPNDRVKLSGNIAYSTSEVDQKAGYVDTRFNQYRTTTYVGTDVSNGGTITGWGASPVPNQSAPASSTFFYDATGGGMPNIGFENPSELSTDSNLLYKSHWALGSTVDTTALSVRGDVEVDLDGKYGKTLKFGFRHAKEEATFDELRYLSDFSKTTGNVASPTLYNTDGSVKTATTFDPTVAPAAGMQNVGIREAVYYDLCGNGGIVAGKSCDINGDGFDDNQPFGPYGYFMDAGIGSKSFDLQEKLYITNADGDTVSNAAAVQAFQDQAPVWFGVADNLAVKSDENGTFISRPLAVSLYGVDTDIGWERWRNSPGYLPWETYSQNPSRATTVDGFFSGGSYNADTLRIEDAGRITSGVENWIDGITPNTPGQWFQVPFESWNVEQMTDAFYTEVDFEGNDIPWTFNIGLRAVSTQVSVTKATVENGEASTWSIASDGWNSQGVLLDWVTVTETKTYWDLLPSMNYTLELTDDSKLRVTAAKVLARPGLQNLGKGFSKTFTRNDAAEGTFYQFIGGTDGNPNLDPFRAKQVDATYEWYFGDLGMMAGGVFFKSVDSFIETTGIDHTEADGNPTNSSGTSTAPVNRPVNGDGGSVHGFEFQYQQAWESGFGTAVNYTYSASQTTSTTDSDKNYGLPGVSEHSFNVMGFYETEVLSARLAYTWRDAFVSGNRASFGVANSSSSLTEHFDAYGQLDAQVSYDVMENLSVSLEAINLTEEGQAAYLGWEQLPSQYVNQERRVSLGVTYRM